MSKFLGIDTSCYTTSLAVYDSEKGLICEERIILKVKMEAVDCLSPIWSISMLEIYRY